jgi:hypothetical protein
MKPPDRKYIGDDKPQVKVVFDRTPSRRDGYPYQETDYEPRFDEDQESLD